MRTNTGSSRAKRSPGADDPDHIYYHLSRVFTTVCKKAWVGARLHTQQTRRRPNADPMLAHRLQRWPSIKPALVQRLVFAGLRSAQQTQNICITFVQCVEDVGPALYKCYTNVSCLLGIAAGLAAITSRHRPNVS